MNTRSRMMSVQEVADWLNVRRQYIYRLVSSGRIKCVHVGRHIRIRESAVLDFLGEQ